LACAMTGKNRKKRVALEASKESRNLGGEARLTAFREQGKEEKEYFLSKKAKLRYDGIARDALERES